MLYERWLVFKSSLTLVALVWSLPCVRPHVLHQITIRCARVVALVFKIPQGDFSKPRNLNVTSDLP